MPKRVIDFDAIWASDKLARCAAWARAEYTWVYGLADANGSFELTNPRVIFGRVYAIREDISIEMVSRVFDEFHAKGLLFIWEENGKRYGHWTGSDMPGRLPSPSWRARFERLAPPVSADALAAYCSLFSNQTIKSKSGAPQALNLNLDVELNVDSEKKPAAVASGPHAEAAAAVEQVNPSVTSPDGSSSFQHPRLRISRQLDANLALEFPELPAPERRVEYTQMAAKLDEAGQSARSPGNYARAWMRGRRSPPAGNRCAPQLRDLTTGVAPSPSVCGARINPAALARIRAREAALASGNSQLRKLESESKERAS